MPRSAELKLTCERCRTLFTTRSPEQRFCSRSCGAKQPRPNRQRRPDFERQCPCGTRFTTRVARIRFCSPICGVRFGGRVHAKVCATCRSTFETKVGWQLYCSPSCRYRARNARAPRTCEECGSEYRSADKRRRYCSRRCAGTRGWRHREAASPRWKGGRVLSQGYIRVRATHHPRARPASPYVFEHILVMERMLGRYLERNERVHHKNGRRDDNRPENLELWKMKDPPGVRASDYHCAGCTCERELDQITR